MPVVVTRERFEEMVADAIDSLPDGLRQAMDNVAIVVEDSAPGRNLYGLYEGIPLTNRNRGYVLAVPDKITIYQDTICQHCSTEEEVIERVGVTVVHEIAHHFGIDDRRLKDLGWA